MGSHAKSSHAKYSVNTKFIKILFDIHCKHKGENLPAYRVYVNDELFTERTWIWHEHYLEEMLQIDAPPGRYQVRVEAVRPVGGKFKCYNQRVEIGDAQWVDATTLEILP